MRKVLTIILFTLLLFWFYNIVIAGFNDRIKSKMNYFYYKLEKTTPNIEDRIDKLETVIQKIDNLKDRKVETLSKKIIVALNLIESSINKKIIYYRKTMLDTEPVWDGNNPSVTIISPNESDILTTTVEFLVSSPLANNCYSSINREEENLMTPKEDNTWLSIYEPSTLPIWKVILSASCYDLKWNKLSAYINVYNEEIELNDIQEISYFSTVDNAELEWYMYIPQNLDEPRPLLVWLHWGWGDWKGFASPASWDAINGVKNRDWFAIAPKGRSWNFEDLGCTYPYSSSYINTPNSTAWPWEQDILDSIEYMKANYNIDVNKIYLMWFSMGGKWTYTIWLRNPDIFAAIAPISPANNWYNIWEHNPWRRACIDVISWWSYDKDNLEINTMYKMQSANFLIENAYNLPVFHAHGTKDNLAYNYLDWPREEPTYNYGFNMTTNSDWDWKEVVDGVELDFWHTPTFSELNDKFPSWYKFAYIFTKVSHKVDPLFHVWALETTENIDGVLNPRKDNYYYGTFDFLENFKRVVNPSTVVFKTYTNEHTKSYWTNIEITNPWENLPWGLRAISHGVESNKNELSLELSRVNKVDIDLNKADLKINKSDELLISIDRLNDSLYSKDLIMDENEDLNVTLTLTWKFSNIDNLILKQNGQEISDNLVNFNSDIIEIWPINIENIEWISILEI